FCAPSRRLSRLARARPFRAARLLAPPKRNNPDPQRARTSRAFPFKNQNASPGPAGAAIKGGFAVLAQGRYRRIFAANLADLFVRMAHCEGFRLRSFGLNST